MRDIAAEKTWFVGLDEAERVTALGLIAFYLTLTGREFSLETEDRVIAAKWAALNELQHTLTSEIVASIKNQPHYPAEVLWKVLSDKAAAGSLDTALARAFKFARRAE
jgi:hypothetical protein